MDGLRNSTQRWDIVGQQVFFGEKDRNQAPEIADVCIDGWEGFAALRRRITQGWVDANVRSPVVLTGYLHRNWAHDVRGDLKHPASPVVGGEFACTFHHVHRERLRLNGGPNHGLEPHLKFHNDNRGYMNTRTTGQEMTTDFRALDSVTTPGAPVSTKASYKIRDGLPGPASRGGRSRRWRGG